MQSIDARLRTMEQGTRAWLLARLALVLLPAFTVAAAAQPPRVAARVNGEVISTERLQRSVDIYVQRNNVGLGNMFNPDHYKEIRQRVLEMLIGQELLWQEARSRDLVVSREQVNEALARIRARQESERLFQSKLSDAGFDEESFAENLKRRLSVQRLIEEDIETGLSVGDDEIHEFYEANRVRFIRPPMVRASHILVEVPQDADEATRESARLRAESLLAEARAGADFAELARRHSDGPSAAKGGDLGYFTKAQMVKPFATAAFALEPGQLSGPVRTRYGYHVIKLVAHRDGGPIPEEEAKDAIRAQLLAAKRNQAVQERVQRLRAEAQVELLVPM